MSNCSFTVNDIELTLLPDKAVYIKSQKILMVTDIHIGKTGHFRKAGMPVPPQLAFSDLDRLSGLITEYNPEKLIVLGDMFHAKGNFDMKLFSDWRKKIPGTEIILVKGNHDVLPLEFYRENNVESFNELFLTENIKLVHRFMGVIEDNLFTISGHVHPAVRLQGKGRQKNVFHSFFFSKHFALLPAFGEFTGNYIINPAKEDAVFIITKDGDCQKVLKL